MSFPHHKLEEFCEFRSGGSLKYSKKDYVENGVKAVSAAGIDGFVPRKEDDGPAIILSSIGARCGKCFLVDGDWTTLANTQIIYPNTKICNIKYLWYVLNDEYSWIRSGTAQPFIKPYHIKNRTVPLPGLKTQDRIVEKIEALLTEIANGVENLDAVERKLDTYRQSVLKAAVTGKLTPDVRASGKFRETGSELLQRVLKERATAAWLKIKDPLEPRSQIDFQIPETWTVATVDQLSLTTDYGTSAKCSPTEGDVPVLRMGNLQDGELDLSVLKYLSSDRSDFPKLLLRDGDLLFNRTNSAELVGKTSVYRGNPSAIPSN